MPAQNPEDLSQLFADAIRRGDLDAAMALFVFTLGNRMSRS
jgi:hypothetical protein